MIFRVKYLVTSENNVIFAAADSDLGSIQANAKCGVPPCGETY